METIKSLNYSIVASSKFSYWFLKKSAISFSGSTTILYSLARILFHKSYSFDINGSKKIWPINSISDFRLIRGEYISNTGKYSLELGYEGVDISYIKNLIEEGDFIIDIGANKGFYTLLFASYIKDHGKVISIEASEKKFKSLFFRITRLWNLTNVLPFNFILGDSDYQRVNLKKPSRFDDGTGFYLKKSNNLHSPFSRTLDNLLSSININNFKLLKIDVEGAEVLVLNGAKRILEKTDYVLVEVSDTGKERFETSVSELYNLLNSVGFLFPYLISLTNNLETIVSPVSNFEIGNILFSKKSLL